MRSGCIRQMPLVRKAVSFGRAGRKSVAPGLREGRSTDKRSQRICDLRGCDLLSASVVVTCRERAFLRSPKYTLIARIPCAALGLGQPRATGIVNMATLPVCRTHRKSVAMPPVSALDDCHGLMPLLTSYSELLVTRKRSAPTMERDTRDKDRGLSDRTDMTSNGLRRGGTHGKYIEEAGTS